MRYIETVNDYEIYEYNKTTCFTYGLSYPAYGAFLGETPRTPDYEECSMEDLDALIEWCEKN